MPVQRSSRASRTARESHNNVKPSFTCDVCGRVSPSQSAAKRHHDIHEGDEAKTLVCPFEGCSFKEFPSRKHNFNAHKRIHTQDRIYQCPDCSYSTPHSPSHTRHRQKKHGYTPGSKPEASQDSDSDSKKQRASESSTSRSIQNTVVVDDIPIAGPSRVRVEGKAAGKVRRKAKNAKHVPKIVDDVIEDSNHAAVYEQFSSFKVDPPEPEPVPVPVEPTPVPAVDELADLSDLTDIESGSDSADSPAEVESFCAITDTAYPPKQLDNAPTTSWLDIALSTAVPEHCWTHWSKDPGAYEKVALSLIPEPLMNDYADILMGTSSAAQNVELYSQHPPQSSQFTPAPAFNGFVQHSPEFACKQEPASPPDFSSAFVMSPTAQHPNFYATPQIPTYKLESTSPSPVPSLGHSYSFSPESQAYSVNTPNTPFSPFNFPQTLPQTPLQYGMPAPQEQCMQYGAPAYPQYTAPAQPTNNFSNDALYNVQLALHQSGLDMNDLHLFTDDVQMQQQYGMTLPADANNMFANNSYNNFGEVAPFQYIPDNFAAQNFSAEPTMGAEPFTDWDKYEILA